MEVDKFISHRGANTDYIENTMPAFELAASYGFSWIEIDVQMSSDGELFIFHDKTTTRLSDVNFDVTQILFEDISNIILYKETINKKSYIPSMKEYLDWMNTNSIKTNIEIKINNSLVSYQEKLVDTLFNLLSKYPLLKNRILISSFSDVVMEYISKDNIYVKARLYESKDWNSDFDYIDGEFHRDFIKNKYIAIVINSECLNKNRVNYLKSKFFKVFVYSAKTDCQVKVLLDYGVDSVFIDKKEQLSIV